MDVKRCCTSGTHERLRCARCAALRISPKHASASGTHRMSTGNTDVGRSPLPSPVRGARRYTFRTIGRFRPGTVAFRVMDATAPRHRTREQPDYARRRTTCTHDGNDFLSSPFIFKRHVLWQRDPLSRFRTEAHLRFSRSRREHTPDSVGVPKEENGKGCRRGGSPREHTPDARIGEGQSGDVHRGARGRRKPLLDQRTQRTFLKLHALLLQRPSARLEQSHHPRNRETLSAWLRHLRFACASLEPGWLVIRYHMLKMCRLTKY